MTCPSRVKKARRDRLMRQQKRIVRAAQRGRVGDRVRLVVDGVSEEHELVLRGRLAGQAPEIDPQVFLTECDPSQLLPGTFRRWRDRRRPRLRSARPSVAATLTVC